MNHNTVNRLAWLYRKQKQPLGFGHLNHNVFVSLLTDEDGTMHARQDKCLQDSNIDIKH